MLSNNQKKLINSLVQKKYRLKHNLFIAEGEKCVNDLLSAGLRPKLIVYSNDWKSPIKITNYTEVIETSIKELQKVSLQKSPQNVLALFEHPKLSLNISELTNQLILILDGIQDPGNLGTIIRLADWFGVKNIISSNDTVDWLNPKVVQSTMGAMGRVAVHYQDLPEFIPSYKKRTNNKIYGTLLEGKNIYTTQLDNKGAIILGNEGQGIRDYNIPRIDVHLTIPPFTKEVQSESLNVATASAIILSEFNRRIFS